MHEILTQRPFLHGRLNGRLLDQVDCRVERLDERTLAESPLRYCYNLAIGCDDEWREVLFVDEKGEILATLGLDEYGTRRVIQELHEDRSYDGWTVGDALLWVRDLSRIKEIITIVHRFQPETECEVIIHTCKGFSFIDWIAKKRDHARTSFARMAQPFSIPGDVATLPKSIRFNDRFMIEAIGEVFPFAKPNPRAPGEIIEQIVVSPVCSATARWQRYWRDAPGSVDLVRFYDADMNEVLPLDSAASARKSIGTAIQVGGVLKGQDQAAARIRFVVETQCRTFSVENKGWSLQFALLLNIGVVPQGIALTEALLRPSPKVD